MAEYTEMTPDILESNDCKVYFQQYAEKFHQDIKETECIFEEIKASELEILTKLKDNWNDKKSLEELIDNSNIMSKLAISSSYNPENIFKIIYDILCVINEVLNQNTTSIQIRVLDFSKSTVDNHNFFKIV